MSDAGRTSKRRRTSKIRVEDDVSKRFRKLLKLWRLHLSCEPISAEEKQCLSGIIFDQMPSQRVNIVTMERLHQPDLLQTLVAREVCPLNEESNHQRSHRELMALHGTRWEHAQSILERGLNPDLGHLGKGTWLGQNALSAHSYAAKGPGPKQNDGSHLFVLFVVACVPDSSAGDMERSFGVWRIMSARRMRVAYMIKYTAPLDLRVKQYAPQPRMNKSYDLRIAGQEAVSPQVFPTLLVSQMDRSVSEAPRAPSKMSQELKCKLPFK